MTFIPILIVVYLLLFLNAILYRLPRKLISYLYISPIILINLIYFPKTELIFALLLSLLIGLSFNYSKKWLLPIVLIIILIIKLYPITITFHTDLNTLNQINSQRGEDLYIYNHQLLAKILHNKTTILLTLIKNLEQYLNPVKIFASANYQWLNRYYSIGYLFFWDFLIILYGIYHLVNSRYQTKKLLTPIILLIILVLPISLGSNYQYSSIVSMTVSFLLLFFSVKTLGKLQANYQHFVYILAIIFNLLHLITINEFIAI